MQADRQLSTHFWLSEFTSSAMAVRRGLNNEPNAEQIANLVRVATLLEAGRAFLGGRAPITVLSGYRSPAVNSAVRGAVNPPSAHLEGRAADVIAPAFGDPIAICKRWLVMALPFDQMIFEGTWVHVSVARAGVTPRGEVLTAHFNSAGVATYAPGLPS